jgi:hypothetical protein
MAAGSAPVQSIIPEGLLPKSAMRPMASANLPDHLPWLPTKPANSLPTVGWAARAESDGKTKMALPVAGSIGVGLAVVSE